MREGKIKKGYKVTVTDKDGILQDVIELEGYDLSQSLHRASLGEEIREGLPAEAFEDEDERESLRKQHENRISIADGLGVRHPSEY